MGIPIHQSMGDLQDPIDGGTLVPYVWPYFGGISPYIGLKNRPYIGLTYGRYLQ
jgi:D-hexose-6-phosphate mutarotase